MEVSNELQTFIEENIDTIEQNTKESWEEVYSGLSWEHSGELTQVMLDIGVDPAAALGYIPENYLRYSAIKKYEIPNNVTSIGYSAFDGCESLTSVTFEENSQLTSIYTCAFYACSRLTSIKLPDSLNYIGWNAFQHCKSLASIEIPNSVLNIDDSAFSNCYSLTSLIIPNSVTSIGEHAFYNCSSLKNIRYNGTKDQWKNIQKGTDWKTEAFPVEILCTDGVIKV